MAQRAVERAKAIWWWKVRIGILDWLKTHPMVASRDESIDPDQHVNTFFDPGIVDRIPETIRQVRHFDRWLRAHLDIAGRLRAWEYGVFLKAFPELQGRKILDAGIGASTFAAYCAARGAEVIGMDLAHPHERCTSSTRVLRRRCVALLHGSVMSIPVKDAVFDIVLSVSVLEHLGEDDSHGPRRTAREQQEMFSTALREMARVLKPTGRMYLTFEVCDRRLQTDDGWAGSRQPGEIWGAYDLEFVGEPLRQALAAANLRVFPQTYPDPQTLLRESWRQNYRGRYISTVCLVAGKDAKDVVAEAPARHA